jgi:hypothetical protein
MTDRTNSFAELIAACWKDPAFRARFASDPKAVLSERGIDIPHGVELKVVENTDRCVYITLPCRPANFDELSDEELANAAGGKGEKYRETHDERDIDLAS